MTSPGIVTFRPGNEKTKRSHNTWNINLLYLVNKNVANRKKWKIRGKTERTKVWASFLPSIVIDGVNLPLLPNRDSPSGLANSSFGFGSHRLPSTRDHTPMEQFQPMMLYKMQQWSWKHRKKSNNVNAMKYLESAFPPQAFKHKVWGEH